MSIYTDLTTILGDVADGNFYLQVYPQEMELPCVVFRVLGKEPIQTLCGNTGDYRYQAVFECWADTFLSADSIADDVKAILEADTSLNKSEASAPGEDFEPVTEAFMQPVYYEFFYKEVI